MFPDIERIRANVARAETEDLLDRATVYRAEMEPEALEVIEGELRRRGIGAAELRAHAERRRDVVEDASGRPLRCARCDRPAVERRWGMHRLWGVIPLFPIKRAYCELHR